MIFLPPGPAGEALISAGPGLPPTYSTISSAAIPDPLSLGTLNADLIQPNTGTSIAFGAPLTYGDPSPNQYWGNGTGTSTTTGIDNVGMGPNALSTVTTGDDNSAFWF